MQKKPSRRAAAPRPRPSWTAAATLIALVMAPAAQASLFSGETLDTVANVMSWIVLFVVPFVVIGVFLIIHILPEKIAEKKQHPQLDAIKTLCLLSLVFGGMLWPLAWLWAYSKPVMHKLAYGTDKAPPHDTGGALHPMTDAGVHKTGEES